VRWMTAGSGQGGVVRRWWDCSRRDRGKGGLLVDLWQVVVGSSRCQLHLLIGDTAGSGSSASFKHPGMNRRASRGDLLGCLAPSRAWEGEPGGALMMAEAAVGAGVERAQKRLQAQTQQHPMMIMNDMMKVALAMLKAQRDMEAPETAAERAMPNGVR